MKLTTIILLTLLTPVILASKPSTTALNRQQCDPLSFTFIPSEGAECRTGKIGTLITLIVSTNCQEAIFEITVCRKEATNRLRFAVIKLEACVREQLSVCENRADLQRCSSRRLARCTTNFIPA